MSSITQACNDNFKTFVEGKPAFAAPTLRFEVDVQSIHGMAFEKMCSGPPIYLRWVMLCAIFSDSSVRLAISVPGWCAFK